MQLAPMSAGGLQMARPSGGVRRTQTLVVHSRKGFGGGEESKAKEAAKIKARARWVLF